MNLQPRKGAEPSAISESCWPVIWLESNSRPTTTQAVSASCYENRTELFVCTVRG
jgi:hypothetical protein